MLGRTANSLFWMFRYLERAENTARLLEAALRMALTRDLVTARPGIYWTDCLASAALGYGALAVAIVAGQPWLVVIAGLVAALALYRATLFIHELTHIRQGALPGFRFVWNLLVGIPLLMPSFLYEGVHTQHHAKTRYGTIDDPESVSYTHLTLPTKRIV